MNYFVYCPEGDIRYYETEQEAKEDAECQIKYYRKEANFDGEWCDAVSDIVYGKVIAKSVATEYENESFDYELQVVKDEQ